MKVTFNKTDRKNSISNFVIYLQYVLLCAGIEADNVDWFLGQTRNEYLPNS